MQYPNSIIKSVGLRQPYNERMFNIFNTKTKNFKKLALVSGAMIGAMAIGTTTANASTKIDQNHVRVEQGDTVSQIAKDNGTTVDAIVQANHLTNPDMIFVGDNLVLTPNADNNNNQSANVQNNVQPASQATNYVAPAQDTNQASQTSQAPVAQTTTNSSLAGNSAAEAISQAESGGSYTAQNGRYYGKYQLDMSYLGGDLSPQHQDEVFQQYCNQRYGSIENALAFRQSHGWY